MEDIIEHGLRENFSQNPKLMQELLATNGKMIGEATKRKSVWG